MSKKTTIFFDLKFVYFNQGEQVWEKMKNTPFYRFNIDIGPTYVSVFLTILKYVSVSVSVFFDRHRALKKGEYKRPKPSNLT